MIDIIQNTTLLLPLILIVLLNSTMDKISTRYNKTLWSKLGADRWFKPTISWRNKHDWRPSWLFKTVLVWTTDFWHLLKFLMLNTIFIWLIVLYYGSFEWTPFITMWLFWGGVFELNYSIRW